MAIIAKEPEGGGGTRILAPDGLQPAICVDVVDHGMQESKNGKVAHKVAIYFLLNETIPTKWKHPQTDEVVEVPEKLIGLPFGINRWFTNSLFERAALRIFLKTWRGKDFTEAELEGFDLEKLIGVPAALNIVYNHSDFTGKWYANIEGVSKLPPTWDAPEIPKDYVRIQDREPRENAPLDDDLPF